MKTAAKGCTTDQCWSQCKGRWTPNPLILFYSSCRSTYNSYRIHDKNNSIICRVFKVTELKTAEQCNERALYETEWDISWNNIYL